MSCKFINTFNSSIVKKQFIGFTGLLLCGFLVTHLAGNLLILVGDEAFNRYAYTLTSNKAFLYTAETILGLIFLGHLILALRVTYENYNARPVKYAVKNRTGRGATFASSTMPVTGFILLFFIIWHLNGLKFGPEYVITYNNTEMRDLYRLLLEYFSIPLNVFGYVLGMVAMGIHVSHGFWSAFQSLGFNHSRYTPLLNKLAIAFAFVISVSFSILPIYCYFKGVN